MALSDELTQPIASTGLRGQRSGFLYQDFLPQLRGPLGARQYKEMSENDATVGAVLYAIEGMIRRVTWNVEPADDSAQALAEAEWLDGVLFKDMSRPFGSVIDDALTMLTFGYAPMEMVFKRRQGQQPGLVVTAANLNAHPEPPPPSSEFDDGLLGIHRLFLLDQETIWQWHFDREGDWFAVTQVTTEMPSVTVPRSKMLNFRNNQRLDNPESTSILRTAYVPYTRKKTIEVAMGRLALRASGIIKLRIPVAYMDQNADDNQKAIRQTFEKYARQMAQEKTGAILIPSDGFDENGANKQFDVEYLTADGRTSAMQLQILEMYDRRIAMSVAADFLLLGQGQTGSRALGESKTGFFGDALGGFLRVIKDELNRTLIPRLWQVNGKDPAVMPQLAHGDFEQRNLVELAALITAMAQAGAQMFPDPTLENALRGEADLPALTPEQRQQRLEDEDQLTAPDGPIGAGPSAPAGGNPPGPGGTPPKPNGAPPTMKPGQPVPPTPPAVPPTPAKRPPATS